MYEENSVRGAAGVGSWTARSLGVAILVICVMVVLAGPARAKAVLSTDDVTTAFGIDSAHDGLQSYDSLKPPLVQRWSVYLPLPESDPQVSFPVIVGGRVYVTAWSYPGRNYAYALNLHSGDIVWGPVDIGPTGHWSSLTYDAGRLFVTDSAGNLLALDPANGKTLWEDKDVATSDAPTAAGGVLYTGPGLQAYDEASGKLLWSQPADSAYGTTGMPAVAGGTVYTAGEDDNLFAFSTAGKLLWQYAGPDTGSQTLLPVVSGTDVYVRSPTVAYENAYPGWIHSTTSGNQIGSFRSFTLPAVDSAQLYTTPSTATSDEPAEYQELQAVSRKTGAVQWSFDGDNQLDTAPVLANGVVYEGSWLGDLYAVDAATGKSLWSTTLAAAIPPSNEAQQTSPLSGLGIGGGYLVVPTTLNGETSGPTLTAFAPAAGAGTLSANAMAFGSQAPGTQSARATVRLYNSGAANLTVGTVGLSGPQASSYTVGGDTCAHTTLAAGASCTVSVTFRPAQAGAAAATLSVVAGDGIAHAVTLSGTGSSG